MVLAPLPQAGGAALPQEQRAAADALAAHAAATAAAAADRLGREAETGGRELGGGGGASACCDGAPGAGRDGGGGGGGGGGAVALRAAALRALAASVLAPAAHRPPFLPLALGLFRQVGAQGRPGVRADASRSGTEWACVRWLGAGWVCVGGAGHPCAASYSRVPAAVDTYSRRIAPHKRSWNERLRGASFGSASPLATWNSFFKVHVMDERSAPDLSKGHALWNWVEGVACALCTLSACVPQSSVGSAARMPLSSVARTSACHTLTPGPRRASRAGRVGGRPGGRRGERARPGSLRGAAAPARPACARAAAAGGRARGGARPRRGGSERPGTGHAGGQRRVWRRRERQRGASLPGRAAHVVGGGGMGGSDALARSWHGAGAAGRPRGERRAR